MHLLPAFLLLVTSTASAASLVKRVVTPDDLIQDISNINEAVLTNQQDAENFDGGDVVTTLVEGTPVLVDVAAIHVVNRKGYADANLSPSIDENDTMRIFQYTIDTVGVSIPSAVETLEGKKEEFVASGMQAVVLNSLELLLNDHDTFSSALEAKAYTGNATLTAEGDAVVKKIHDAIQGGIDTYSS